MMRPADNPFRVDRLESLGFELLGDTWPALLDRLKAMSHRAAVVGPHGSGKTTLLENLAEHLQTAGWRVHRLFMNAELLMRPSAPAGLGVRDVVLFDGADHLSRRAWWRFERATRVAGGLVITSHCPGLLPTLIETRTTPALLAHLVERLTGMPPDAHDCCELFERHRGNLRSALRELYDRVSRYTPPHG